MNKNFIRFYFSFIIFIIISLFIWSKQDPIEYNLEFPVVLTLLNNRNAIVSKNGIHFYDQNLTMEHYKNYTFETPLQQGNIESISMAQFEKINGEYILILVKNIIYIFSSDEILLNNIDLSSEINGDHYCLIPYKKIGNEYLDYFILFVKDKYINIKHFKFHLNNQTNEIENKINFKALTSEGAEPEALTGINCIFMTPISSFNTSHDLLTCFYSVNYPPSIVSSVYNQENNFTEITRFYHKSSYLTYQCSYINGITGQSKSKALVYMNQGRKPYSCTFDFTLGFSTIISESENNKYLVREEFYHNKMKYIIQFRKNLLFLVQEM